MILMFSGREIVEFRRGLESSEGDSGVVGLYIGTAVAREKDRTAFERAAGTARPPPLGVPFPPRALGRFAPLVRID
jgi:hypothetical protein